MKIRFLFLIWLFSAGIIYSQTPDSVDVDKLLFKGKFRQVIEILSGKDSLSASEHYKLGKAYMNLMQNYKSLNHFLKAVRQDAFNTDYLFMTASLYELIGRPLIAKFYFDRTILLDSSNIQAKIKLAKVLMDLRDYKKAAELYGEMVKKDSLNEFFVNRLSICKIKTGDTTAALNLLTKIYRARIFTPKTALLLAKIYFNKGKYDSAANVVSQALQMNQQDIELNRFAGEIYFKQKKYRSAITKFLQSVTFGDSTADIFQKLGLSYYQLATSNSLNKNESAEEYLNNALKAFLTSYSLDGKNQITAMYLGLIYKEKGEYEKAIQYLEKSLDLIFPSYLGSLYFNLAASYDLSGNFPKAINAYRNAIKYLPPKPELNFYLASVYDRYYADKSVALKFYSKFLNEQKNSDAKLVNYAKERIERLKEVLHFSKSK